MRTERQSRAWSVKPASAGWWMRVLVALLFVFQTGYVRYHLLTEVHHDDVHAAAVETGFDHDDHDDGDHHDSDHHKPHSASDHLVQLNAKHQTSLLAVDFLSSETSFQLARPETVVFRVLYETGEGTGRVSTRPAAASRPSAGLIPPSFRTPTDSACIAFVCLNASQAELFSGRIFF